MTLLKLFAKVLTTGMTRPAAREVLDVSLAQKLVASLGHTVHSLWALAQAYAVAGEMETARRLLRDLEELQGGNQGAATQVAILYGLLGETDRAFACLEEAYRNRQPLLCSRVCNPEWIAFDRTRAFTRCWQG